MKTILGAIFILILMATPASAAIQNIVLNDGSVIKGEILSMQNGVYKIRSVNLGLLNVHEDKIRSVSASGSSHSSGSTVTRSQIDSIQKEMVSDPEIMALIQALVSDPELVAALSDPSFMQKIQSGDMAALQSDPTMKKLMEHPDLRVIIERMTQN